VTLPFRLLLLLPLVLPDLLHHPLAFLLLLPLPLLVSPRGLLVLAPLHHPSPVHEHVLLHDLPHVHDLRVEVVELRVSHQQSSGDGRRVSEGRLAVEVITGSRQHDATERRKRGEEWGEGREGVEWLCGRVEYRGV
jgi:hypothetical protein